jgi:hypothetical protein
LLPKTSAFIFLPVGLADLLKEKQIMFWRSMRILTLYIKKRARKRGLVQGGMT